MTAPIFKTAMMGLLLTLARVAGAGDVEDLAALLDDFLARAGERPAHERFWADDLVYTSSAGTRTNKTEILQGFAQQDGDPEDAPAYHAEDVDIRLYGDTAVVAFRLVAVAASETGVAEEQHYYNTGTFVRRDGAWRAAAWQATRIPAPE